MKKFMKTCAIWALILISCGLTIVIAGCILLGPEKIARTVETTTNGNLHVNLDPGSGDGFGIYLGSKGEEVWQTGEDVAEQITFTDFYWEDWQEAFAGSLYDIEDFGTIYEKDEEIFAGERITYEFDSREIKDLEIDAGGCRMDVAFSEDDQFRVEGRDVSKLQVYVKNKVLHITSVHAPGQTKEGAAIGRILLCVPRGFVFGEADLEVGAGVLNMQELLAKKAELEVGAGRICVGKMECEEAKLEVGAGDITVLRMDVEALGAKVGLGNLALNGSIEKDGELECAMGNITLQLTDAEEDFTYRMECAMGNIQLNDAQYSGLAKSKEIKNSGGKTLKLECAMGSITVRTDEDP